MGEKKPEFSEKVDNKINGFAIGISFSTISLFLLICNDYFEIPVISYIVGAIFGLIGFGGLAVELSETNKIKGIGELIGGLAMFVPWLLLYLKFNDNMLVKVLSFGLLILGLYVLTLGIIKLFYSSYKTIFESKGPKSKFKSIFLLISQLLGLTLTVLNILKIFGVFK